MTAIDRRQAARTLRALRQRRGWSWGDAARTLREIARRLRMPTVANARVSTIQRSIARWENDAVQPGERYQLLLAHVYAEHDGAISLGPGSDFDELMTAFAQYGIWPERIAEVRDLIARGLTSGSNGLLAYLSPELTESLRAALADPALTDSGLASQLETAVSEINSRVGAVPFVRLQLGLIPLVEACRALLAAELPHPIRTPLLTVATTGYALAARLAFETHDSASAADHYAEALAVAGEIPDRWHRAAVRTSQTMVTFYASGDLSEAQRIADASVSDARSGSSVVIRARAHALQAEMAARAGNGRRALAALHTAWHEIDSDTSGDPATGKFDAGRLHGFEGLCHLYTGDSDRAERQFADSARELRRPRDAVQRAIVLTDRALAQIKLDAPQPAVQLLHKCVDLTASTRGRVPAQRIREARLALSPWRSERFVADLDDHIHTALIGGG